MGWCGRLIIFALFLILFGSSGEMATKKVAIFDNDKVIKFILSPEDATRARNNIVFATTLLNAAKKESSLNNPDGINNSESDGGFYRWTTSCMLLMLQTYKENEEKFTNGKHSQKKIWEEIAKILKCNGHNVTGPMCAAKLKSLKKTYKAVKDHNNKSDNDRRSWQFFEIQKQNRFHDVPLWRLHLPQDYQKSSKKRMQMLNLTVVRVQLSYQVPNRMPTHCLVKDCNKNKNMKKPKQNDTKRGWK
ncbi:uncharacterized protein LOC105202847 [Solenopsis invicta]|uniref:uncharacterized protein LOC105202847 n=1 Tax=Solenopsis invicta TaxID=13686 RepID=UPI00193D6DEB|nr:uncharacterized protein LOC105202847 [Solenopsis invicta]